MIKTVLNAAKNAKGWSNQKLAEAAKLPLSTVTNILGEGSKTENPRWDTVTVLARTLGVPLSALEDEPLPELPEPPKPNTVSEAAAYYEAAKNYLLRQVAHEQEEKEKERAERRRWQAAAIGIAASLIVILILVLVIIIVDIRTPGAGWFRVN